MTITPENNVLNYEADGVGYSITIPEGEYTKDEIIAELNNQLASAPIRAVEEDGVLKLEYKKLGKHTVSDISGTAAQDLFYNQNGAVDREDKLKIQLSSININRPIVSTSFLGINGIVITQPKYANVALERIDEALDSVNEVRSMFGANQNRLEYAIANNNNTSENTQSAESRLRDTDMAAEMVQYSKHNILEQAGMSVLAQAQSIDESVLRLLQ